MSFNVEAFTILPISDSDSDVSQPPLPNAPLPALPPLPEPQHTQIYHPHLTGTFDTISSRHTCILIYPLGLPCDKDGNTLPLGTLPTPCSAKNPYDWSPFEDESQFHLGNFLYCKVEMSTGNINELMDIWSLSKDDKEAYYPFDSHMHMYETINSITNGDAPWRSFTASYSGEIGPNPPSWQLADYMVWYCGPTVVTKNMLDNPDFNQQYDYQSYIELDASGQHNWNEFMSGNFSWHHATKIYEDDPTTEGATYCPIAFGADKTTLSVATGHVEYHPFYLTLAEWKHNSDVAFQHFKQQLYHSCTTFILKPLHPGMIIPVVHWCPDGHFQHFIYDLAAFIVDYPEQVYLTGTVQIWCPNCTFKQLLQMYCIAVRHRWIARTMYPWASQAFDCSDG
ncbi:hypothetical protein CVT25_000389 [Psilocybe cyanescens]|uniref:Uncharacterized protein n=1 Tax=Psilocybe cyanescens TaxID=93625 RepID=A0A409XYN5_PSICY|nr:hypothetical protein CVT25_000389 [Psilocybe cyanescens]